MAVTRDQKLQSLGDEQYDAVEREQLLGLGLTSHAIAHMLATGRLYPVHRGVYAIGRRRLTRRGEFMAAVLRCGRGAGLMSGSAAALWGVLPDRPELPIEVSVRSKIRAPGIVVRRQRHRRIVRRHGIPVTSLVCTFIDLAAGPRDDDDELEAAVSKADIRGLINPEQLRRMLEREAARKGLARLQRLLDRRTFRVTRSKLERHFLAICRKAGLPLPLTRVVVNGYEVDFYWPELGLVVESDGLTYHRTALQQAVDIERDHSHAVRDIERLRFTHYQVVHEPEYVESILVPVITRLRSSLPTHGTA